MGAEPLLPEAAAAAAGPSLAEDGFGGVPDSRLEGKAADPREDGPAEEGEESCTTGRK